MIYSFHCTECDNRFEKAMRLAEYEEYKEKIEYNQETPVKCDKCDSDKVEIVIGGQCNFSRFWQDCR